MSENYVYILADTNRTVFVGRTTNLQREIQHFRKGASDYISRAKVTRLVHFERISSILGAVARESIVKNLSRVQKHALIEQQNSNWNDLAEKW